MDKIEWHPYPDEKPPDGEITPYVVPNEKTQEEFEDEVMGLVEKTLVSGFSNALNNKTQDQSSDRTVATFKAMLKAEAERLGIKQRDEMTEWHKFPDEMFEETGHYVFRLEIGDFIKYATAYVDIENQEVIHDYKFERGNITHWFKFNKPCSDEPLAMSQEVYPPWVEKERFDEERPEWKDEE